MTHNRLPRRTDPKAYDRLDLAGLSLHPAIITGNQGRAAMVRTVTELGYPQRAITPALTRWSRVYVIQLGGDRDAGTVDLLGARGPITVKLPDRGRHCVLPTTRVEALLAAVQTDYPPTSLTATLAESLAGVLDLCARHRQTGERAIPWRGLEATIAPPLRAFCEAWEETHS